jgi:hypothetical protein
MRIRIQAPQKQDNVVLAIKKFFIAIVQGKLIGKNLAEKQPLADSLFLYKLHHFGPEFLSGLGIYKTNLAGIQADPMPVTLGPNRVLLSPLCQSN